MDKMVATYTLLVQDVQPDKRNPREVVVKVTTDPAKPYYYLVNASPDLDLKVGTWYSADVLIRAIGYKDKVTAKVKSFLSTWVLSASALQAATV